MHRLAVSREVAGWIERRARCRGPDVAGMPAESGIGLGRCDWTRIPEKETSNAVFEVGMEATTARRGRTSPTAL